MNRKLAAALDRSKALAPAIIVDELAGFVRVRDPRIFHAHNRAFCQHWAEVASRASKVVEARVDLATTTCQVDFRPGTIEREAMARLFADSIHDALMAPPSLTDNGAIPANWQALQATSFGVHVLESGSNQTKDYLLAAGAIAMTGVAILVPGLPTVPFLLASSYYLARTSPRLNRALHNAPFFGPILQEMEEHKALSRKSKRLLMGFVLVVIAITMATTASTLPLVLLMLIALSVSLYSIHRMPEIAREASAQLIALPAS